MHNDHLPCYEVFAIRYAWVDRRRAENFIAHDPHEGNMPMDYFVWLIRDETRAILVDTGFNEQAARYRKRNFLRCPIGALNLLGVQPGQISDVILTHLHYDHAGNLKLLPNARMHLQEKEMQYATGKYMKYRMLRQVYEAEDVIDVVRGVYAERAVFYDGDAQPFPGIELILIGGHTMGLQSVRVHTKRGWVVLASDASHYYDNMNNHAPFPIVFDVGAMLSGYDKLQRLADSSDHLVPGHDPEVMRRYRPWGDASQGIVALHESPRAGNASHVPANSRA